MEENLELDIESWTRSATAWIEKGKRLLISADILNKELLSLCGEFAPDIPDELQQKFLGLMDSLLLLMGFSIENAIKGNIIANKPDYTKISELNLYNFNAKGGHGILSMVIHNMNNITAFEKDLLQRLELSIIWAGRYNSPKRFEENKKVGAIHPGFKENDFETCSKLFEKIEKSTYEKWEKNENSFYDWRDSYIQRLINNNIH